MLEDDRVDVHEGIGINVNKDSGLRKCFVLSLLIHL